MIKQIILHTIITEKRNIFFGTMIMAAIFLFFSTIGTGSYTNATDTLRIDYATAVTMAKITLFVCMILSASKMMAPLKKRSTSIQFLMLPASNKDKFIARWLIGVVGYSIMFLVALIAADAVQALYNIALRYTTGSLTAEFFSSAYYDGFLFFEHGNPIINVFFEGIISFLLFHSVYTLGSTFFKTQSFIKTSLLLIGTLIIGSTIIGCLLVPLVYSDREYTVHFLVDPEIMGNITYYVVTIGMTVGAYYWAYRRFCNKMI